MDSSADACLADLMRLAAFDKTRAGFSQNERQPAGNHLVRYLDPLGKMRRASDPAAAHAGSHRLSTGH